MAKKKKTERYFDTTKVRSAGIKDEPTAVDNLGFGPYVEAIASFLENDLTTPPFTLSIEGDWGSGKSSFMLQLQALLKENDATTINFNAWRHDKVESMWSTFALTFIEQLEKKTNWFFRSFLNLWIAFKRFDLRKGWTDLLFKLALIAVYILVIVAFIKNDGFEMVISLLNVDSQTNDVTGFNYIKFINSLGFIGWLLGGIFCLKKLAEVFGNPLSIDLKKYNIKPDYNSNTAFIESFHQDFNESVKALAFNKKKIYVFIDDLDRAEIPKAAELMQGLNMMISDSPKIIFIIGMDREKVVAGVAAKYETMIKFISPNGDQVKNSLNFGSTFIQKFIQLSFRIPAPDKKDIKRFIESISSSEGTTNTATEKVDIRHSIELEDGDDAQSFKETVELISPSFENNPRQLKQFVNAFRLKCHIAFKTGLLLERENKMTIQQIGKFVAMIMLWPELIDLLMIYPNTIKDIVNGLPDGTAFHEIPNEWRRKDSFVHFLALGTDNPFYNMANVDYAVLIKTSPAINMDQSATIGDDDSDSDYPAFEGESVSGTTTTTTTTDFKSGK